MSYLDPPDDYCPDVCEVCGQDSLECICPECFECGTHGDPRCYVEHGLHRTEEQKFLREIARRLWEDENNSFWADIDKDDQEFWR